MPNVTPNQLAQAEQEMAAALAKLDQTEQAIAAMPPDDPDAFTKLPQLQALARVARDTYNRAERKYNRLEAQFNRENPPARAQTEADRIRERDLAIQEEEKNANEKDIGLRITNAQRDAREQRMQPNKPRVDSPVQIQTANTQSA